jgi:hypothetical protein
MLVLLELDADFSRGCMLSMIRPAFLLSHPHHLTLREVTLCLVNVPVESRDYEQEPREQRA